VILLEDEAVMLFDSYFTFESKLGWHRLFLTVESTRGIRTLAVEFELSEEMVAWGCRNGKFSEQFQILPLKSKVKLRSESVSVRAIPSIFLETQTYFLK